MRETSFSRATQMLEQSNDFVTSPPVVEGQNEIVFTVKGQCNSDLSYKINISPNLLMTNRNKRDRFKNFCYKCSCEDFQFVSTYFCKHIAYILMLYFISV